MDETKDLGVGRVLEDCLETRLVVVHVLLNLTALNVKHIDEHLHVPEDILPLAGEVVVHEHFLAGESRQTDRQTDRHTHSETTDTRRDSTVFTHPPQSQRFRTRLPRKRT